jgi:predicted PurR-regulated permease PerM
VNLITATGMLVLLLLLGVDDALLWAVGTFFLSFVPYLGLVLAMIPPAILALAESGPLAAATVIVGATALNLIAENVVEPTLTGRALSLSIWLVFVMFFFWVWLIGPLGALLSMPITVLVVLVLQHNERTRWLGELLARQPAEPDPEGGTAQGELLVEPAAAAGLAAGSPAGGRPESPGD